MAQNDKRKRKGLKSRLRSLLTGGAAPVKPAKRSGSGVKRAQSARSGKRKKLGPSLATWQALYAPTFPARARVPSRLLDRIGRSPILCNAPPTHYLADIVSGSHNRLYGTLGEYERRSYLLPNQISEKIYANDSRILAYMDDYREHLTKDFLQRDQSELVSIVMPTRNRSSLIVDAILSVEMQTYQNWELIVVDDAGDSEETRLLVAEFGDDRIRYIRLETVSGNGSARNAGVNAARGSILAYLDDDDQWHPDHLLVLLYSMRDADRQCAYGAQLVWRGFEEAHGVGEFKALRYSVFNRSLLENMNYISMIAFIHDRSIVESVGPFDPHLSRYIDWEFFLRVTELFDPLAVPCVTSHYFLGRSSISVSHHADPEAAISEVRQRQLAGAGWQVDIPYGGSGVYKGHATPEKTRALRRAAISALGEMETEIVIPNYECPDELEACIRSILAVGHANVRITVVDNGSSGETRSRIHDFCEELGVRAIMDDGPRGFSHAVNRGLEETSGSNAPVLLLNNDTIVTPDWLEELHYVLRKYDDAGMVVPRQVLLPGSRIMKPHVPSAIVTYECDINVSEHHQNLVGTLAEDGIAELSYAPLFAGLIRRDVIDRIGGLNPRSGEHYRSDWIFCDNIRRLCKRRILYTRYSKVYHLQGVASSIKTKAPRATPAN